jgi:hypothetical protein
LPEYAKPRPTTPDPIRPDRTNVWIPKNPAESPERLSAEIISHCRIAPGHFRPKQTEPNPLKPYRIGPFHDCLMKAAERAEALSADISS